MNWPPRRHMVAIALLLLGAACAPRQPPVDDTRREKYSPLTLDCIFISTIDSWKYLDPYHVIIYAPSPAKGYLLELSNYCQVAQHAERIAISSHQSGRLCARDQDALLVGGQRCSIATIQPYKPSDKPERTR